MEFVAALIINLEIFALRLLACQNRPQTFHCVQFGDCWVDYCHVRINVVRCICCPPQCGWKMHVLPWMNGFRLQNPKPHTALDDILPCGDNATAQEAALRTTLYGQVEAAANVSYVLYCYDKFSTNLQTCRFVMVAFRDISSGECHGLEKHSSWICNWVGNLSAALEVFWVIYGRERKQCLYIKNCFLKRAIGNSKTRRVVI